MLLVSSTYPMKGLLNMIYPNNIHKTRYNLFTYKYHLILLKIGKNTKNKSDNNNIL